MLPALWWHPTTLPLPLFMNRRVFFVLLSMAAGLAGPMAAQPKGDAAKAAPVRQGSVGMAIGANVATPINRIKAPHGFQVELLRSQRLKDEVLF